MNQKQAKALRRLVRESYEDGIMTPIYHANSKVLRVWYRLIGGRWRRGWDNTKHQVSRYRLAKNAYRPATGPKAAVKAAMRSIAVGLATGEFSTK